MKTADTEKTRNAVRASYRKHYALARVSEQGSPHEVGLYGALSTRYMTRGAVPPESDLWIELTPFVLMTPEIGMEALAEYVVFQEWGVARANVNWLRDEISKALRNAPPSRRQPALMASGLAEIKGVAWCLLLDPGISKEVGAQSYEIARRSTMADPED